MKSSKKLEHELASTLKKIRVRQKPPLLQHIANSCLVKIKWLFHETLSLKLKPKLNEFISQCQKHPTNSIPQHPQEQKIDVSIIIPVYNKWNLTRSCINSILHTMDDSIRFEIILADDCSEDETVNASSIYPGVIVSRTSKNCGFLRNCNQAARLARGDSILLLNNDTIVLPNWLGPLYKTLNEDPSIAIVGSKILNPNGSIQEAGCMLFADGRMTHVGAGYPRDTALFNLARDVDYISGCSILIRKSFWEEVGGFDERYIHGYYEDSDLAMTAYALNYRVVYQPESEIIHFRGRSYAMRRENQYKNLAKRNLPLFLKKWEQDLKRMNHRVS